MFRRMLCALPMILLAGCTAVRPTAAPSPPTAAPAPPPAPRPVPTLAERLRREGWLSRFWEQLTRAQRRRVLARMKRADPPMAQAEEEAAPAWDALGLAERESLVFGPRS